MINIAFTILYTQIHGIKYIGLCIPTPSNLSLFFYITISITQLFIFCKTFFGHSYNILERSIGMNYYNPYYSFAPTMSAPTSTGLLGGALKGGLRGGINFGSILSGTQKVLGIANQAIPLVKQAAPVMKNAKTMFRLMNEFKKVDAPRTVSKGTTTTTNANQGVTEETTNVTTSESGPTFFL